MSFSDPRWSTMTSQGQIFCFQSAGFLALSFVPNAKPLPLPLPRYIGEEWKIWNSLGVKLWFTRNSPGVEPYSSAVDPYSSGGRPIFHRSLQGWMQFYLIFRPQLFKRWIALSTGQKSNQWITQLVSQILIHWIVIYPVDSAIQRLRNRGQEWEEKVSHQLRGAGRVRTLNAVA